MRRFERSPTQQNYVNMSLRSTDRVDEKLLICFLPVTVHQRMPLNVITEKGSHIMSVKDAGFILGSGRTVSCFSWELSQHDK